MQVRSCSSRCDDEYHAQRTPLELIGVLFLFEILGKCAHILREDVLVYAFIVGQFF